MRDWTFWEWIAYASLWITALIEAAGVALLRARELRKRLPLWLRSHQWSFVPLVLPSIATVVLVIEVIWPNTPARLVKDESAEKTYLGEVRPGEGSSLAIDWRAAQLREPVQNSPLAKYYRFIICARNIGKEP